MTETIGQRLRRLRIEKGWSGETLAAKLECSEPAVSYWENGQRHPRPDNLLAMARLFGVSISYMETGEARSDAILHWASRCNLTDLAKLHNAIRSGASREVLVAMVEDRG